MGTVFKKTFTKPMPANAETFVKKGKRFARWKDAKGKSRTAPTTTGNAGTERIVITASTYTAKYRNGAGVVVEHATGCRDEVAARKVLADLERRAELVKANVMTAAEDAVSDHQAASLAEHIAGYLVHLESDGTSLDHRGNVKRCLNRLAAECGFAKLNDLRQDALERWFVAKAGEKMSARTRNLHRACAVAFCNWCIETNRLVANPFSKIKKADEEADPRRKRRALTEEELTKLLQVARRRPLLDKATVRRGKNKGQAVAELKPATKAKLESIGRERALIYKTLVLTGLRKGELASLTVGQLELDATPAFASLNSSDEKNGEGNDIPLRADLADDLRQWLRDNLAVMQVEAGRLGEPIPAQLPAATPLFTVPKKLVRILNRDLKLAGIEKKDERGRTVDVHALRHSFGTLLSKGGVQPRTAQAAMRHSSIDLTMNVYTDPRLLDVHGALDALPMLPLAGGKDSEIMRATGTTDSAPPPLAPSLAPNTDPQRDRLATVVKMAFDEAAGHEPTGDAAKVVPVKRNSPLTTSVNGLHPVGDTRFELVTPSLSS